jgi:hypothetical protein
VQKRFHLIQEHCRLASAFQYKPRYNFAPRKSLEEVVDVLKENVSHAPTVEPIPDIVHKPTVKKNPKKKKQGNSDSSFTNKGIRSLII